MFMVTMVVAFLVFMSVAIFVASAAGEDANGKQEGGD